MIMGGANELVSLGNIVIILKLTKHPNFPNLL